MYGYLEKGIQTPISQGRSTHDDKVNPDHQVVNKELSLQACPRQMLHVRNTPSPGAERERSLLTTYWSESALSS